jgi:hypothetical protein
MGKFVRGLLGVLGFLIGIALIAWAGLMIQDSRHFLATAKTTTGVVTDLRLAISPRSARFCPIVRYTAEGAAHTIIGHGGSNPPAYSIGDAVEVIYPPGHPQAGRLSDFIDLWMLPLIPGDLGLVPVLATLGAVIATRRRGLANSPLHTGRRIEAKVTEVATDTTMQRDGIHPFRIEAQWLDPSINQIRLFKSDRIWFNPTDYMPPGGRIGVFIDPTNPKKYHVDISFMPKLAT